MYISSFIHECGNCLAKFDSSSCTGELICVHFVFFSLSLSIYIYMYQYLSLSIYIYIYVYGMYSDLHSSMNLFVYIFTASACYIMCSYCVYTQRHTDTQHTHKHTNMYVHVCVVRGRGRITFFHVGACLCTFVINQCDNCLEAVKQNELRNQQQSQST